MLSNGMKIFTDIPIVVVGMSLFLFAFISVFFRTFLRENSKAYYQKIANLTLNAEDNHE